MNKIGEVPSGSVHTPAIIALWDTVGITHELNGYRNDAMGWIEKYAHERELEIGALSAIEGAKKALENRNTNEALSGWEAGIFKWNTELTQRRLENYKKAYPGNLNGLARQKELCERWERDAAARLPMSIAKYRERYVPLAESEWQTAMAEIDKDARKVSVVNQSKHQSVLQIRDATLKKRADEATAESNIEWTKYENKLDTIALNKFKFHYSDFLSAANLLADQRTDDVVLWIRSSYLQDALLEFDSSNIDDGNAFEDTVGEIILGISSSPAGKKIIKEWIDEAKARDSNLLWRAIAFNQDEGINAVNSILSLAIGSKDIPFSETSLNTIRDNIKYVAKLGDLVKKSISLHNTLRKPGVRPVKTAGIEKILMTVGHFFFQPFIKKTTDLLSEKFILALLLARAGVEYSKIMNLLVAESKFSKSGRAETLLVLSIGHIVAGKNVSDGTKALEQAWAALAQDADTPKTNLKPELAGSFNEAKELRFGIVATLVQMAYLAKLFLDLGNQPENKRLKAETWVAGLSMSAALVDLGATGIKGIHPLKDAASSFQGLKLAGGLLSAGSAWISAQEDYSEAKKDISEGKLVVGYLYYAKSTLTGLGGVASIITAISYTKPAFDLIAYKFPTTIVGRASVMIQKIGVRIVSRLFVGRALLMLGSIWFSVGTLAVQLIIWKFSDDKLQKWCEISAFGVDKINRTKNPKQQILDFENALLEVI